jgi:hypothetical protein
MKHFNRLILLSFIIATAKSYAGGFGGGGGDALIKEKPPVKTDKQVQGLIEALTGVNPNDTALLKDAGVKVGGAILAGVTYNPANPSDRSNFPVTFNDRSNEFQLNRFRLFIQKEVNTSGKDWDIGGRFDFVVGADARYATTQGLDDKLIKDNRFNTVALPQTYATIFAPYGNGITAQIGHFFTVIGSVSPFYSVSYVAYSEPNSHTGVLLTTPINDNLTVSAGAVLGTVNTLDNFDKNLGVWNFLGSATWAKDSTTVTTSLVTGDNTDYGYFYGDFDGKRRSNRTHVNFVFNQDFAEKWHYKFQTDYGYQGKGFNSRPAHWYGIEQNLLYDINQQLTAGLRGEWFRDQNGLKVMIDGIPTTYYGVTAGLFWKPVKWVTVRPEVRYDITVRPDVDSGGNVVTPIYNDLEDRQQLTFATSVAIRF